MTNEITTRYSDPTEVPAVAGMTPLLTTRLDSQALKRHRATLVIELEKLAKKFDRFGWDRDRGTPVHDGMILDWMDALQDYPLGEVSAACRQAVLSNPNKMPNEGHVLAEIKKARGGLSFEIIQTLKDGLKSPIDSVREHSQQALQRAGIEV